MKGLLVNAGYKTSENKDDASVWILNSCTVKDPSEMAFVNLVKEGIDKKKHVIIAGCVPQADRSIDVLKIYLLLVHIKLIELLKLLNKH